MSLSIRTGAQGERTVVIALHGEVDYTTAQQFREEVSMLLADGGIRLIAVDLGGVSFLDSTGVGTLVVARRICADCGVQMELQTVNPFIARLFAVLGVSDALGVPAPAGLVEPRRRPSPATGWVPGTSAGRAIAGSSLPAPRGSEALVQPA